MSQLIGEAIRILGIEFIDVLAIASIFVGLCYWNVVKFSEDVRIGGLRKKYSAVRFFARAFYAVSAGTGVLWVLFSSAIITNSENIDLIEGWSNANDWAISAILAFLAASAIWFSQYAIERHLENKKARERNDQLNAEIALQLHQELGNDRNHSSTTR